MQSSTLSLVNNEETQAKQSQSCNNVPIYKIFKTITICFSFLSMGLYTEIIGACLPDLKLQHKFYNKFDLIGILFGLRSATLILGALVVIFIHKNAARKPFNNRKEIFNKSAKLDFLLSVSFFLSTTGCLLIQFVRHTNIIVLFVSFACIGFATGILLIAGSLSFLNLWFTSGIKLFTTRFRFLIFIFYATGAFIAPALVRIFLKPFIYSYRQYYEEPNKEFLQQFQITNRLNLTTTTTRVTPFRPLNQRFTIKSTHKPTVATKISTPNVLIIDFLRLDPNHDGGDSLYRLFANYFNLIFYILTALNATMVIIFSILFLVDIFETKKERRESAQMVEMKSTRRRASIAPERCNFIDSFKKYLSKFLNFTIIVSVKNVNIKPKTPGFISNLLILFLICIFYSLIFATLKIQSSYLVSYSIHPEYVQRYYDEYFNEMFDYTAKSLKNTTETKSILTSFSFIKPYSFLSLSLVDASYTLCTFYLGSLIGVSFSLCLINIPATERTSPIGLIYAKIIFNFILQLVTFISITLLDNNTDISLPWYFIQFFNGLSISSLCPLIYDYFSNKQEYKFKSFLDPSVSSNLHLFKSSYLTACELIGLSIGAGLFQWLIGYLIELNNNFNSFINIPLINSSLVLLIFLIIHIFFVTVNRMPTSVAPN